MSPSTPRRSRALWPLCLTALLCACGGSDDANRDAAAAADREAPLPQPQRGGGSITGMPEAPGPGEVPIAGEPPAPPPEMLPGEAFGLPPLEDNPETGLAAGEPPSPAATQANDIEAAAAVLRDYYAAIAAGDHARAYASWSDGGRASGQSPQQFAAGFADTADVAVQLGAAGTIEGAAGSRYVEIPISVTATRRDGSVRRYAGRYVLRRTAADAAGAEQQAWRIGSAELREIVP